MCSYAKNKLQMCSVTQHQCRRRQMWGKFHKFTQLTHSLSVTKNDLSWLNNLFMVCFTPRECPLMLKTNHRCVQSPNISVDVANCRVIFDKFTLYTHFQSVTKNDLSWLNNPFMARFQLVGISYYAKKKQQMCSETQRQCRRRQMWGKF